MLFRFYHPVLSSIDTAVTRRKHDSDRRGIKGRAGTTTVVTNLAVLRSRVGRKVLLVDTGPLGAASGFAALRSETLEGGAGYTGIMLTNAALQTERLLLRNKYQDIFIDIGVDDRMSLQAAVSISDVLLVPTSSSIETFKQVTAFAQQMQVVTPSIRVCTFLNRVYPRGVPEKDFADALGEDTLQPFVSTPLSRRSAFRKAVASGLAVTELRPRDVRPPER